MVVYLGINGLPESLMRLKFNSIAEASEFCESFAEHFCEERGRLFMAMDVDDLYEDLDLVYSSTRVVANGEIEETVFEGIIRKGAKE